MAFTTENVSIGNIFSDNDLISILKYLKFKKIIYEKVLDVVSYNILIVKLKIEQACSRKYNLLEADKDYLYNIFQEILMRPKESLWLERIFHELNEITSERRRTQNKRYSHTEKSEKDIIPVNHMVRVIEGLVPQTSSNPRLQNVHKRTSKSPKTSPEYFSVSKRNPGCMRKCLEMGILHPAQCHFLC